MKRQFSILICFLLCLGSINIISIDTKAATPAPSEDTMASDKDKKEAKAMLSDLGYESTREKYDKQIQTLWSATKVGKNAMNDSAIAGAVGNFFVECHFNPKCEEAGGGGIGLAQWTTNSEREGLVEYTKKNCKDHKDSWKKMKGYEVCTKAACQWGYFITDFKRFEGTNHADALSKNWKKVVDDIEKNYKTKAYKTAIKQRGTSGAINKYITELFKHKDIEVYKKCDQYRKADKTYDAAVNFHASYEVSAGTNMLLNPSTHKFTHRHGQGWSDGGMFLEANLIRPLVAESLAKYYAGLTAETAEVDKETAKEVAKTAVSSGVWGEEEFVSWKKMTDIQLEFADIKSLNDDDLHNLKTWQEDIEKDTADNILITGGRWIVLLFGIIFEIWMLLMYLAYWFDRLNNFIDVDLLKLISFGKLVISPTEEECTFSVRSLAKGETRTINHRHMLMVCAIGLAFGTLIVSGTLFDIVNGIVQRVLDYIG